MLEDTPKLDKALAKSKAAMPKPMFHFLQPFYHWILAMLALVYYRFPARGMKLIGVTGTKGKSTATYMIAKILEDQGYNVAMIGSLGYKINKVMVPNVLKMTMPGRFKLQKFLHEARKAKVQYVVIEVTSEGIAQHRLQGITIDCAVFTNLHKEHIESHGSFERYIEAKKKLFKKTRNIHVVNVENDYSDEFLAIPCKKLVTYGLKKGDLTQDIFQIQLKLSGEFNIYNALAAIGVAHVYGLDFLKAKTTVESIDTIPGRMEYIEHGQPFEVVIDYAHTPESLEGAYQTLKNKGGKLICVLGAAGGGRDTWKRPVFGEIAESYCDEIILTNEDPYDEPPQQIIDQIASGIKNLAKTKMILDRGNAIYTAIADARANDTVIVTGKGSETSISMAGGKKVPWSDKDAIAKVLEMRKAQQ